jgi:hypothetical protein
MTTEPQTPEHVYEPWSKTLLGIVKGMLKLAAWVFGIGIAIVVVLAIYDQLDINGYLRHEQTTDVYMTSNWMVGENRVCSLTESYDGYGHQTGKVVALLCPFDGRNYETHNVSVTFKGVLDPKDMNGKERPIPDQWKCTRGSDNFTCEAMANPAKPSTP